MPSLAVMRQGHETSVSLRLGRPALAWPEGALFGWARAGRGIPPARLPAQTRSGNGPACFALTSQGARCGWLC